jgi:hypothetical protein
MDYGTTVGIDFNEKQDTIITFLIRWNKNLSENVKQEKKLAMQSWLKIRLEDEKLRVINY